MAIINTDHFQFFFSSAIESADRAAYIREISAHRIWSYYRAAPTDDVLGRIWDVAHMTVQEMRVASGLTQAAFAAHICAPKRTVEDWCSGKRTPPSYVRLLVAESMGLIDRTIPTIPTTNTEGDVIMEKRFVVVDSRRPEGDRFETVHRTAEEANEAAARAWSYLTPSEKKTRHIAAYVVDETMLDPDDVEDYGLDSDTPWMGAPSMDSFPGAFDSDDL